jgi:hypothetical protein
MERFRDLLARTFGTNQDVVPDVDPIAAAIRNAPDPFAKFDDCMRRIREGTQKKEKPIVLKRQTDPPACGGDTADLLVRLREAGWVDTGRAAKRLRLHRTSVQKLIRAGDLAGIKGPTGFWLVDPVSVSEYAQSHPRKNGKKSRRIRTAQWNQIRKDYLLGWEDKDTCKHVYPSCRILGEKYGFPGEAIARRARLETPKWTELRWALQIAEEIGEGQSNARRPTRTSR